MANQVSSADVRHYGGCHCSAIRFEVWAPSNLHVYDCNCSVCFKKSNLHFVVPGYKFKILKGEELLTTYTFNTHQAKHLFCKLCGTQSFYVPRSNPDGYGVNPRCLDQDTVESITVEKYDGLNWEASFELEKTKPISIQSRSK